MEEEIIFELLDDFTSGGKLYYDDEYKSIWMINPDTKQWIFEFKKTGTLWYSYPVFTKIFKYVSMDYPDFNPYIKKWVERILQKEAKNTQSMGGQETFWVERILQKEVKNTIELNGSAAPTVERILQQDNNLDLNENINESEESPLVDEEIIFELLDDFTSDGKLYYDDKTESIWMINPDTKEWIFEFEKSGDLWYHYKVFESIFKYISMEYPDFEPYITKWAERILQKEVKDTANSYWVLPMAAERILQKEIKDTIFVQHLQNSGVERILQQDNNLDLNENINDGEEPSSVDEEIIFELLDDFTNDYDKYQSYNGDTFLINPNKKDWLIEIDEENYLWYNKDIFVKIFKYVSMEYPDFEPYITKWVEKKINIKIKETYDIFWGRGGKIIDVITNGFKET